MGETRKTVTIVFSDVVGSTNLGERLDAEALRRVMERYFAEMRAVLERHGGLVEKFIGDAVMAVFGIPVVHADDALRAVRAAAQMTERLAALSAEFEREPGIRFAVRTGVNTGEVIAGDPESGQFFATGDAVNVAARLQGAAGPGEIMLGQLTYQLVSETVRAEALAPLKLKGKTEPIDAWRLVEVLPDVPAFTRRLDVSFVGRSRELEVLRGAFERAHAEGSCGLVTIVGAPGIGKSRLAREFRAETGDEVRAVVGRCLPYGEGITYWPLVEVVRQIAGTDARTGLDEFLAGEDEGPLAVERLAAALGLVETPTPSEEIFWAIRILFEKLARERPLITLVDDIHWAEPTFLDMLEYLVGFARGPILLICNARPDLFDSRPDWSRPRPSAQTLVLEPLDKNDSKTLVDQLLAGSPRAEALCRRIVETAEGNPLFLEQMLALARESKEEIAIPPTIQALLAERLDRLPPNERAIAEAASVEGRLFHRGTVAALLSDAERDLLAGGLVALVRKELARPDRSEFPGDDGFRFAHMLIRDAAYEAIPKVRRADQHERVALLFESRSSPGEVVGYHFEQAYSCLVEVGKLGEVTREIGRRGAAALATAGHRASARGDKRAAVKLLSRAVQLVDGDDPRRLDPLLALGTALFESYELPHADAVLSEAIESARALGEHAVEWRALLERCEVRMLTDPEGAAKEARQVAEQAIEGFERMGDELGMSRAWRLLAAVHHMWWSIPDVEEAAEQSLRHARRAGDIRAESESVSWLAVAIANGPTPIPEAIGRLEMFLRWVQAHDDRGLERILVARLGLLYAEAGDFAQGRKMQEQQRHIVENLGLERMLPYLDWNAGLLEFLADDLEQAERLMRCAYDGLLDHGDKGHLSTVVINLAEVLIEQGRYDEAATFIRESENLGASDDAVTQMIVRSLRARLLARQGDFEHAELLAREAVELARATGAPDFFGHRLMDLGHVLHSRSDRLEEARLTFERALNEYEKRGSPVFVEGASLAIERLAVSTR
jgi:class 3 adenylate cyclase/tetratricopeptide (TPR) repeat protein